MNDVCGKVFKTIRINYLYNLLIESSTGEGLTVHFKTAI